MISIIPAMDLMDGKCVRLTQGDFARRTIYEDEPLEVARRFEAAGVQRLHMVDLDGAKSGAPQNISLLETIAGGTSLQVDFGGGIKSKEDVERVFDAGAAIVTVGSIAISEPGVFAEWLDTYGPGRVMLAADVKEGKVAIDAWRTGTKMQVRDLIATYGRQGLENVFVTDISRDGAMTGPAVELYSQLISQLPGLSLIASGGVRSMADVEALERAGCAGVIVGKAIYEGDITMEEISEYAG